jgi:hypothetical protein
MITPPAPKAGNRPQHREPEMPAPPVKACLPPAEAEVAEVRINPPEPAAGKKTPRPCRKPELPDSPVKPKSGVARYPSTSYTPAKRKPLPEVIACWADNVTSGRAAETVAEVRGLSTTSALPGPEVVNSWARRKTSTREHSSTRKYLATCPLPEVRPTGRRAPAQSEHPLAAE